jgi:hypothetical protein
MDNSLLRDSCIHIIVNNKSELLYWVLWLFQCGGSEMIAVIVKFEVKQEIKRAV